MDDHSSGGQLLVPNRPFQVALLTTHRDPSVIGIRLAELVRSDGRFRLAAVLEIETQAPADTRSSGANGAVANVLLSLLLAAEKRVLRDKGTLSGQDRVASWSETEPIRIVCPGGADWHSSSSAQERVRALELDAIVDLDGVVLPTWLSAAARRGVWSVVPGATWPPASKVTAFSEISAGCGTTAVTLVHRGRDAAAVKAIAKAFYPARMTCTSTIETARRKATELIWRELKKVQRTGCLTFLPDDANPGVAASPRIPEIAGYVSHLGGSFINAVRSQAAAKFSVPRDRWSLFVGSGRYDVADWSQAVEARPPAGEYWADPFLLRREGDTKTYVFFESFEYGEGRGKISVGSVSKDGIAYLGDAVKTGYHLSYPFVFEHEGNVWMIPESHATRRLELWRCIDFPLKWELEKTVMEGRSLADSTLCEHEGEWWLFTNEAGIDPDDHNSELHIYRIDSPMLNEIVPHAANPVVIDATRARNGGRIHRANGSLLRPAQNNAFRYGYGLGVHRIKALTLVTYEEEPVLSIEPNFRPGITCCHHLDSCGEIFVFDARLRSG